MRQPSLKVGALQLAITSLLVLAPHSTHQLTQTHAFENFQIFLKYWISWKKSIIWTKYFYCFSFHLWRHCQGKDSNTTFREIWMASKIGLPIVLHRPTCCSEKWRRNPVLPQRFFLPKKRKYCYSTINAILWEFIFCFIPLFDKCWFDRNRHIAALSDSIKM